MKIARGKSEVGHAHHNRIVPHDQTDRRMDHCRFDRPGVARRAQTYSDPQSDAELRKRIIPLVPSFQAALMGDNVDAQRATLSVIADIPPNLVVGTNLAKVLKNFLRKDIKDPNVLALGLRSFGRSFPDAPDVESVIGPHVSSKNTIVRRAAAEGLTSALANSYPRQSAERKYDYFADTAKRAIPLLAVDIQSDDSTTQKVALGGIRIAAERVTGVYTIEAEPLDLEPKAKAPEGRFGVFAPVIRALAIAAPKLSTPLGSPDSSTRLAAARTLESLAILWKTIRSSHRLGEPEPPDPFAGSWPAIRDGVAKGIKDPDPDVRLAMTEALESLGDAMESRALLREATKDKVLFVRWAAARSLGESAPANPDVKMVAPDVAALARLVEDKDLDVRTAAITALGKYGAAAKSAAPVLLEVVGTGDIEPRVAAVKALEQIQSDAAATVPALIEGLKNKDLRCTRQCGRLGALRRQGESRIARASPSAGRPRCGTPPRRRRGRAGHRVETTAEGHLNGAASSVRRRTGRTSKIIPGCADSANGVSRGVRGESPAPRFAGSLGVIVFDVLQIHRAGFDVERLPESAGGATLQAACFLPNENAQFALHDRCILDFKVAVLVRDREVRMIENAHPCLHPRVDRTSDFDWEFLCHQRRRHLELSAGRNQRVDFAVVPRHPLGIMWNWGAVLDDHRLPCACADNVRDEAATRLIDLDRGTCRLDKLRIDIRRLERREDLAPRLVCSTFICSAVGSGASQTKTFLMPPFFGLTTQSSVLKSLSLAQTF